MRSTATTADRVEALSWVHHRPIEVDPFERRMYVRAPHGTFWAPLAEESSC